jgi:hypothetical protein
VCKETMTMERSRVARETKTKTSSTEKRHKAKTRTKTGARRRRRGGGWAGEARSEGRGGGGARGRRRESAEAESRARPPRFDATRRSASRSRSRPSLACARRHDETRVSSSLATASAGRPGAEGPGKESRGRTIAAFARFRSDAARWTRGSSPRAGRATASWRGGAGARPVTISRSLGAPARFVSTSDREARVGGHTRVESRFFRQLCDNNTRFYD